MESVLSSDEDLGVFSSVLDNHNFFDEAFKILEEQQDDIILKFEMAKNRMARLLDMISDVNQKRQDESFQEVKEDNMGVGSTLETLITDFKELLTSTDNKRKQSEAFKNTEISELPDDSTEQQVEIEAPSLHDDIVTKPKTSLRWMKRIRRFGGRWMKRIRFGDRVLRAFQECGGYDRGEWEL